MARCRKHNHVIDFRSYHYFRPWLLEVDRYGVFAESQLYQAQEEWK